LPESIYFDDKPYISALDDMSKSTSVFRQELLGTRNELLVLADGIKMIATSFRGFAEELSVSFTSVSSIGTTTKTSLESVFNTFGAVKFLHESVDALDKLTYGFASITPALDATGIAMGIEMTMTNLATAAQTLLNAAVMLFPAALLIAAIVAVVALFIKYVKEATKASETQQRLNADTQALKESTDDLKKSLEESKVAYVESTSKIATNAGAAEVLAQKIYALSEVENKSAAEKQQLLVLLNQLNEIMPELNLLYDEEANCLNRTTEQVQNLITAKKEELLQLAAAEKAVELARERLDVEQKLREIEASKADWTAQHEEEGLLMVA